MTRLSGPTRYATAASVAAAAFPNGAERAYVATRENFPDALAGVPAAGRNGAPLLLVQPDQLPSEVAAALRRLRASEIGSSVACGSVSQRLEQELAPYATG